MPDARINMAFEMDEKGIRKKEYKQYLFYALKSAVFIVILYFAYCRLTDVFRFKNEEEITQSYYEDRRTGNEVVFLGPSTVMNAVWPMELWDSYGITAYNLGSGAQSPALSFYLIRDVIQREHPSCIVFDCGRVFMDEVNPGSGFFHYLTDNMPLLSKERIHMILDLSEDEEKDYLFPLNAYHGRWKDPIAESDFKADEKFITRGAKIEVNHSVQPRYEHHEIITDGALKGAGLAYLDKIIELCKKTDTKLLLLTIPFPSKRPDISQEEYDKRINAAYALEQYCTEKDTLYLNLLDKAPELGIDYTKDTYDGEHLSMYGAIKFTRYIGKVLNEDYGIGDSSGASDNSIMEKAYVDFREYLVKRCLLNTVYTGVLFDNLNYIAESGEYVTVLSVNGHISGEENASFERFLNRFGLKENVIKNPGKAYIAILDGTDAVYEETGTETGQELEFSGTVGEFGMNIVSTADSEASASCRLEVNGTDYLNGMPGMAVLVLEKKSGKAVNCAYITDYQPDSMFQRMYN